MQEGVRFHSAGSARLQCASLQRNRIWNAHAIGMHMRSNMLAGPLPPLWGKVGMGGCRRTTANQEAEDIWQYPMWQQELLGALCPALVRRHPPSSFA